MSQARHIDTTRTPSSAASGAIVVQSYEMSTGERFPAHDHEVHQLVWASSGVVTIEIDRQCWVLPPTLALFVPAGISHATSATKPTLMRGAYLALSDRCNWTTPTVVGVDDLLRALIERLATERLSPVAQVHAEAILFELLEPVSVATIDVPIPDDVRLRMVTDALLADPADDRSLAAWGRTVGAGERTLSRLFVEDTGLTFARWRSHARLRAALVLLADGMPVARVSSEVGYHNASAFVAAFRQSTGTTPRAYFRHALQPAT